MKRLVVCSDGTWNTADQRYPTNVFKVSRLIPDMPAGGIPQKVFYDPGVGADSILAKLPGVFGYGLEENVNQAYRFLVDNFDAGDQLFFFGFSRGAYTVRSVVGMVRKCGILRRDRLEMLHKAYEFYRDSATKADSDAAAAFRAEHAQPLDTEGSNVPPVRFIGVWDTVGSLGVPFGPLRRLTMSKHLFHDVSLSRIVENAFQALAIDEKRKDYRPTLWEQHPNAEKQKLEQRWFAGVHTDVGGGNIDPRQADRAMRWIIDEATKCGLVVDQDFIRTHHAREKLGPLHESRTKIFKLRPLFMRPIGEGVPVEESTYLGGVSKECVDPAVIDRNLADNDYKPPNLVEYFRRFPDTLAAAKRARLNDQG
jgi:uncharacterized protein (DUF2235 family)